LIPKYNFDGRVKILNLGDIHLGDHNCDKKLLEKAIEYIFDNDDAYWLSTGDILNCATTHSVSSGYDSDSLNVEYNEAISLLSPISDKCLGIVSSNHHYRVEKDTGLNLDEVMCTALNVPYLRDSAVICITVDRCSYYAAMAHSTGGGRTQGAKANACKKLDQLYQGCDIYLTGHTHAYNTFVSTQTVVDRKRNKLTDICSYYNSTGHFLDWKDSYAERMMLPSMPKGCTEVCLEGSPIGQESTKRVSINLYRG